MNHHRADLPMTSSSTFPLRPTSTLQPRKHDSKLLSNFIIFNRQMTLMSIFVSEPEEKRFEVELPPPRRFNFLSFLVLLALIGAWTSFRYLLFEYFTCLGGILILALMSLIYLHILAPRSWMKRNALGKQQHIQVFIKDTKIWFLIFLFVAM